MNGKLFKIAIKNNKLLFMYFIKIIEIIQKYNVVNLRNYILKNYKLISITLVILMLMRLQSNTLYFTLSRAIEMEFPLIDNC